jgi:hypothetical protein
MTIAQVSISYGASKDISVLATGQDRNTVALNALEEALRDGTLSAEQLSQLETIASRVEAKAATNQKLAANMAALGTIDATAISIKYQDRRQGFGPHEAIDFNVTVNSREQARVLLVELLGNDATMLISDWGNRVNFDQETPTNNKVVLFTESNNKVRNSQHDDFKAAGLQFADDLQATIVCATLVNKAKEVGLNLSKAASTWHNQQSAALEKLSPSEVDLLTKLRDGVVRTSSGALNVFDGGRLRAELFYDRGYAFAWGLGCAAPAESKT